MNEYNPQGKDIRFIDSHTKIYSVCRMAVLSALPFLMENLLPENAAILMSTIR